MADLVHVVMDDAGLEGWVLTRINTPTAYRGRGAAGRLLLQILKDADQERETLYLEIVPSGAMGYAALRAWYQRHGFARWRRRVFRRLPRR